jgi:hypothetical protein
MELSDVEANTNLTMMKNSVIIGCKHGVPHPNAAMPPPKTTLNKNQVT